MQCNGEGIAARINNMQISIIVCSEISATTGDLRIPRSIAVTLGIYGQLSTGNFIRRSIVSAMIEPSIVSMA